LFFYKDLLKMDKKNHFGDNKNLNRFSYYYIPAGAPPRLSLSAPISVM